MAFLAAFVINSAGGSPTYAPTALAELVSESQFEETTHVHCTNVLPAGATATLIPPAVGYATTG